MPCIVTEEYEGIIKLLESYPIPVVKRSELEKKLYKKISTHKLSCIEVYDQYMGRQVKRVMKSGRIVLQKSEVADAIKWFYQYTNGQGARKIFHIMKERYFGVGERTIQNCLNGFTEQIKKRPKLLSKQS